MTLDSDCETSLGSMGTVRDVILEGFLLVLCFNFWCTGGRGENVKRPSLHVYLFKPATWDSGIFLHATSFYSPEEFIIFPTRWMPVTLIRRLA